jgi:RND superfamily putative drug exporter
MLTGVAVAATSAPAAPPDTPNIPGAEFQQANDLIQRSFHANPNGATAQIVFVAPHGQKLTATRYQSLIGHAMETARSPQVSNTISPFHGGEVSRDASTAVGTINYTVTRSRLSSTSLDDLQKAAQVGRNAGLTVEIGGDALSRHASDTTMVLSLAVAAVILVVTFGALAAAGLPLLTAFVGVGLSLAGIIALGATLGLSSTTQSLGLMLGLAVGIDYALFIVSRYREERARGREPEEAAGVAVGTAGSAVVFAGVTVIIALVGLSVIGIPTATKMGLAAAATVAVAVLVAITLVPSLLGFFPRAVLARAVRRTGGVRKFQFHEENLGSRWARFVLRYPVPVLLLAVSALGVIAVPAAHLRLGEAGNAILPTSDTQRRAYDDISRAFGAGFNGQLTIVVTTTRARNPKNSATAVASKIAATPGIVAVSQPKFDASGDIAIINAIPATAPDSEQTKSIVQAVRAQRTTIEADTGADYLVTGLTAANIDIAGKVGNAMLPYLLTVVGLAFLLLLAVFRSVLVPLKATLGFVLSVLAAVGALVAVFQWGWFAPVLGVPATGPVQSLIPIFLIGISFGLAMDYEVFLVSRIREGYARGQAAGLSVVSGFRHSARVVTAAALIMISVFAGFLTNSNILVKEIGFGLAVVVVLDAFVVRMTIVPAVLALLGKRAWQLPPWLDKVLPHLDIEGESLERRLAEERALGALPLPGKAELVGPGYRR